MHYCISNTPDRYGAYVVHRETCTSAPMPDERSYLGLQANGRDAIEKAKWDFMRVVACPLCLAECYTSPF